MKINHFVALSLIAVLVVITMSFFALTVFAQTGEPPPPETETEADEDETNEDEAEGPDVPITGDDLEKASTAALEYLGEGRVTGSEVGDEEGYYEIEVVLDDGRQVDVHLDENFNVLSQIAD